MASQLPFPNRSVMFWRRAALLACVLALYTAGSQAHARNEHDGFDGLGGFLSSGHAIQASAQEKRGGQGPAHGRGGEECSHCAVTIENRRGENADQGSA